MSKQNNNKAQDLMARHSLICSQRANSFLFRGNACSLLFLKRHLVDIFWKLMLCRLLLQWFALCLQGECSITDGEEDNYFHLSSSAVKFRVVLLPIDSIHRTSIRHAVGRERGTKEDLSFTMSTCRESITFADHTLLIYLLIGSLMAGKGSRWEI